MPLVLSIILVFVQTLAFFRSQSGHMYLMNPIVDAILGKYEILFGKNL